MSSSKIANVMRRVAEAIADSRIEAHQIKNMTDEALEQLDARWIAELDDEIEGGEARSAPEPE